LSTPPQDKDEILDLLGNFLEQFNVKQNDLNPLINLAILHYQFESILPFYDGNGRAGRILNILYLIINDLLDIPILYLSSYINENKADYYRLLNTVNNKDEWSEYIIYMLKAVEVTSNTTIKKINHYGQEVHSGLFVSNYLLTLLLKLATNPVQQRCASYPKNNAEKNNYYITSDFILQRVQYEIGYVRLLASL
jgi:hypothetical protein